MMDTFRNPEVDVIAICILVAFIVVGFWFVFNLLVKDWVEKYNKSLYENVQKKLQDEIDAGEFWSGYEGFITESKASAKIAKIVNRR